MTARRAFLTGVVAAVAGCAGPGNSGQEAAPNDQNGSTNTQRDGSGSDADDTSGYHLRASPVGAPDREPVLSSDDDALAEIEPLIDLLEETANTLETTYASLSPSEAEAFEEAIANVERYYAGNPPGYYIDHRGLVISVSRSG